ncbi:MAG: hypothetical protein M3460_12780, partial [Actinomycetota bacterium]|nr:hypothetical protein [Actinomycetota bacterium]
SAAVASPPARVSPAGREQQIDQVVKAKPVNDASAMAAALVSIAALLLALGLLGTTGRRPRRPAPRRLPRHGDISGQKRVR